MRKNFSSKNLYVRCLVASILTIVFYMILDYLKYSTLNSAFFYILMFIIIYGVFYLVFRFFGRRND